MRIPPQSKTKLSVYSDDNGMLRFVPDTHIQNQKTSGFSEHSFNSKNMQRRLLRFLTIMATIATLGGIAVPKAFKAYKNSVYTAPICCAYTPYSDIVSTKCAAQFFSFENTKTFLSTPESRRLFQMVESALPPETSTNAVCLYSSVLQQMATDTNGVCHATSLSSDCCNSFLQNCCSVPSQELVHLMNGSFNSALLNPTTARMHKLLTSGQKHTPAFEKEFQQAAYEWGAFYRLMDFLSVPLRTYERDTDYIYWDTQQHPTIGVGFNLDAHPELLGRLRFHLSPEVQRILHPNDPILENQYVSLNRDDLDTLTAHIRAQGETNHKAVHFKKKYQLTIQPADQVVLESFFVQCRAEAIQTVLSRLNSSENGKGMSLLFGSYDRPIPIEAASVLADIAYRGGYKAMKGSPKLIEAYLNHNWSEVFKQCVPSDRNSPGRCNWRQGCIKTTIKKVKEQSKMLKTLQKKAEDSNNAQPVPKGKVPAKKNRAV